MGPKCTNVTTHNFYILLRNFLLFRDTWIMARHQNFISTQTLTFTRLHAFTDSLALAVALSQALFKEAVQARAHEHEQHVLRAQWRYASRMDSINWKFKLTDLIPQCWVESVVVIRREVSSGFRSVMEANNIVYKARPRRKNYRDTGQEILNRGRAERRQQILVDRRRIPMNEVQHGPNMESVDQKPAGSETAPRIPLGPVKRQRTWPPLR